ncbi:PepSY domain-containing protein [Pontibacillus marinus]|uniref:PepSY domain-containing protein n=1 Tax=Pontibacillus marinus BH030004 = DSM 16465 TaxID=1385511 RepID=A0A0A5FVN4_9BACI|nr:PepSY domain-containing protein [Pontibacillus marinus]KGX84861.1 hypothetical protein N783_15740 [Pontibacillus marinus BH030004 = DSM 16465]
MKKLLTMTFACMLLAAGCSNGDDQQANTDPSVNEDQDKQENIENESKNEKNQETNEPDDNQDTEEKNQDEEGQTEEGKDKETSDENNKLSLTNEQAKEVAVQAETSFKEIVNSTEGDSFKVKGYETKEDIVNDLTQVMSQNLAQSLTDAFFVMREGTLYLEPKGGPLWFEKDMDFKLKHPGEKEYVIIQEQNNEMSGNVVMHYTLTHNGDNWVLDQMKSQRKKQNDVSKVTEEQAVELVRKQIGAQGENVKIEFDHMDGNQYVIHVYEVVEQENNSHTATKGWYYVNQDTGEVTNMMN